MADLRTVESLARLQLAARRCGLELRLTRVPAELEELITFVGLAEAFATVYISTEYKDAVAFLLMIAFLVLRPRGLFGHRVGI